MVKRLFILVFAVHCTARVTAQVFTDVTLSTRTVYVGQPLRVTITVYTRTWFTAPVEFGNLQIPGAFIVPFDDTQPGMFTAGGKQYPGIQFYYIVFPYKPGEYTVPPFEVIAQSPPEGSSTGRKVTVHTAQQKFTVRDVPDRLKHMGPWFVAKDVRITQHWDKPLTDLKVGDVLLRTVTVEARGTLPQFIPDLAPQERVDWAGTYPQPAVLTDSRAGGDVSGRSVTRTTYLLEKAGGFEIPQIDLPFWNPLAAHITTRNLPAQSIEVAPNPDLGILATLRDSLWSAQALPAEAAGKKGPWKFRGMTWYQLAGAVLLGPAALWLIIVAVRHACRAVRRAVDRRRRSEAYLFRRFLRSGDTPQKTLPALYRWWDHLRRPHDPSIAASLQRAGEGNAADQLHVYLGKAYSGASVPSIKELLKGLRRKKRLAPPQTGKIAQTQQEFEGVK